MNAEVRFDFEGKVAIVTGAARGVGRALVGELAPDAASYIAYAITRDPASTAGYPDRVVRMNPLIAPYHNGTGWGWHDAGRIQGLVAKPWA